MLAIDSPKPLFVTIVSFCTKTIGILVNAEESDDVEHKKEQGVHACEEETDDEEATMIVEDEKKILMKTWNQQLQM